MNKDGCRAMCTSPQILLREKLLFRMIYQTTTRPREVLEARIELWNRTIGEITFPKTKSKYNRCTRRHIPGAPMTMKLTGKTSEMLRHYLENRMKGHIYSSSLSFFTQMTKLRRILLQGRASDEKLDLISRYTRMLVEQGKRDPKVRDLAVYVTRGCRNKEYGCEAKTLHDYVRKHVRYVKDIASVERFATPRRTLFM